jgi:hypothetical protein
MWLLETAAVSSALVLPIGYTGRVYSVHNDYINLQNDGDFITLVRSGCDHIPFGIEVMLPGSWLDFGLEREQIVRYTEDSVFIQDILEISGIQDCFRFSCQPIFFSAGQQCEEKLRKLEKLCHDFAVDSGILTYLGQQDVQSFCWDLDPCRESVPRAAQVLIQGVAGDREPLIRQGICGLLGVGPGSTPAGDDFLMGFLSASRYLLPSAYQRAVYTMTRLLRAEAPGATTFLSLAYLKYGLHGSYHQRLCELITAFGSCPMQIIMDKAHSLMQLGHSSGADVLTGFIYGGFTALMAVELQKQQKNYNGKESVYENL